MNFEEDTYGGAYYVGITVCGSKHHKERVPNQDSILYHRNGKNYVLAISDGIGSCRQSHIGAQKATSICREVFFRLTSGDTPFDMGRIKAALVQNWINAFPCETGVDYCATLKAAFAFENKLILLSIGDGLLAFSSSNNSIVLAGDDNSFLNETRGLSPCLSPDDLWATTLELPQDNYVIVICTDGIANNIRRGSELDFANEILKAISSKQLKTNIKEFLEEIVDLDSDDKTLGVIKYEC